VPLFDYALHHSEAIDPTLAEWIRQKIDDILGLDPSTIVVILGVVILVFPLALGILASRRRRALARGTGEGAGGEVEARHHAH
jgi:hypothetical protein